MAKRRPFIGYRLRLLLAAGVVALAGWVVTKTATPDPEALSPADFQLFREPRPDSDQRPASIAFLGSSEMGGFAQAAARQLPSSRTINLATQRGNILGFMAIASELKAFHPKVVVVGLEPSVAFFDPYWSPPAIFGSDSLKGYLPSELFEKLRALSTWRYRIYYQTLAILNPFHRFIGLLMPSTPGTDRVPFFARPSTWQESGMDPYWERRSSEDSFSVEGYWPELIQGFTRLARDAGTEVVFVLSPVRLYSHDGVRIWTRLKWREKITDTLRAQGATFFDYFDAFFNGREYERGYFKNQDHLLKPAADALAVRLISDLGSEPSWRPIASGEADPCAEDLARRCPGAKGSDLESCLLRQFDALSLACRKTELVSRYADPCYSDRLRICGNEPRTRWVPCLEASSSLLAASCLQAISRSAHARVTQ